VRWNVRDHANREKLEAAAAIFHRLQAPPAFCGKSHRGRRIFHEMHAPARRGDGVSPDSTAGTHATAQARIPSDAVVDPPAPDPAARCMHPPSQSLTPSPATPPALQATTPTAAATTFVNSGG
jgi:hypothetical protein